MYVFLSPKLSSRTIKRRMIVSKKQGKAWGILARHGKFRQGMGNPRDGKIPGTAKSREIPGTKC